MHRAKLVPTLLLAVLMGAATARLATAQCTVSFNFPFGNPQCGATFSGGLGMQYFGDACGDGYGYNAPDNLYITIPGGVYKVEARIEAITGGQGTVMIFYDADHMELPSPIVSGQGCGAAVLQSREFDTPVHFIEVYMVNAQLILSKALLSAMTLWEAPVSTQPTTWGRVKAMYRAQLQ